MLLPVAVVLHVTVPAQLPAVSVASSPGHTSVLLLLITGGCGVLPVVIVTTLLAALVPQLFVHVAVYVPAPT